MTFYQSTVSEVDAVTRELKLSFGEPVVSERLAKRLRDLSKTARVKGFRPGKAPIAMIERLYSENERIRVIDNLINESFVGALKDHNLNMVGRPKIVLESLGDTPGDVVCTAILSVFPEPTIQVDGEIPVTIQGLPPIDTHIEEVVKQLQKAQGKPIDLEGRDEVLLGDVVKVSYKKKAEGAEHTHEACDSGCTHDHEHTHEGHEHTHQEDATKDVAAATAEDAAKGEVSTFVVGDGQIIPEVDKGVIGKKKGEVFELSVPHQGSAAVYTFKIEDIQTLELPELNDEFAKKADEDVETLEALLGKIKETVEKQREDHQRNAIDNAVCSVLLERNKFEIPEIMVDDEMQQSLVGKEMEDEMWQQLWSAMPEEWRTTQYREAEDRIRLSIMLNKLIADLKITATEEEILAEVKELVAQTDRRKLPKTKEDLERWAGEVVKRKMVMAELRSRTKVQELPYSAEQQSGAGEAASE